MVKATRVEASKGHGSEGSEGGVVRRSLPAKVARVPCRWRNRCPFRRARRHTQARKAARARDRGGATTRGTQEDHNSVPRTLRLQGEVVGVPSFGLLPSSRHRAAPQAPTTTQPQGSQGTLKHGTHKVAKQSWHEPRAGHATEGKQ